MEESAKFKKMYLKLFNAVTDALEEKDREKSDEILKKAQCDCEDFFDFFHCLFHFDFICFRRSIVSSFV